MIKNEKIKIKVVGDIMFDEVFGNKIKWRDAHYKAYYGMSRKKLSEQVYKELYADKNN